MQHQTINLPVGIVGTQSTLDLYRFGTPNARPKIYLQAALHADEWPGSMVLVKLIEQLKELESEGKIVGEIVLLPIANPIGLRQFLGGFQLGRFDFDYSGNFNRGYPDLAALTLPKLDDKALLSRPHAEQVREIRAAMQSALADWQVELEADHLRKTLLSLAIDADFVLDCHCDAVACLHAFANERHATTAKALCADLGAEVLLLEESTGVMAFDEACASPWWKLADALNLPDVARTCFATTLEFRGEREVGTKVLDDVDGLLRFLTRVGAVAAESVVLDYPTQIFSLNQVARLNAPVSGLVEFLVRAGDEVAQGQVVARIHQLAQLTQESALDLLAPCKGKVYALGRNHMVKSGHVLVQIASHDYQGTGKLTF